MNWFKRLCLFVFGLSGLLALAALCLVWVGPWTSEARTMLLEVQWYFLALEVLVCICAVGLLACLLVALFSPRNPRETIVATVDGGQITVTRNAIVSQTRHVVEADGTCVANTIRVRVRKRGHVRVHVRVTPRHPVDVVACGERLYARLGEGLAQVCGTSVQSIDVVFTDPESLDEIRPSAHPSDVSDVDISVPLTDGRPSRWEDEPTEESLAVVPTVDLHPADVAGSQASLDSAMVSQTVDVPGDASELGLDGEEV